MIIVMTGVTSIYAAGDNSNPLRSIALAGAFINKDLIEEKFSLNHILYF